MSRLFNCIMSLMRGESHKLAKLPCPYCGHCELHRYPARVRFEDRVSCIVCFQMFRIASDYFDIMNLSVLTLPIDKKTWLDRTRGDE